MPVLDHEGNLYLFHLNLAPRAFPGLWQRHIRQYQGTLDLERLGADLGRQNFPAPLTECFIRRVCYWGNHSGIGGRVLRRNGVVEIRAAFRDALDLCGKNNVTGALSKIQSLQDLGLSFASKHLRFLCPQKAVILDSIISSRLGYPSDVGGYSAFVADCQQMAMILNRAEIRHETRPRARWWPCDVEMCPYAELRNL